MIHTFFSFQLDLVTALRKTEIEIEKYIILNELEIIFSKSNELYFFRFLF